MGVAAKVVLGTVVVLGLLIVLVGWWAIDRPFGGATCWVNYTAKTYDQAVMLDSNLSDQGLVSSVTGKRDGRPPALPVVEVHAGFWQTEDSLEDDVRGGLNDIDGGKFDQCRTPSLGD